MGNDSSQGYAKGGMAHAAEAARSMGRGEDSMLVHMTPNEVNSLQGLAMAMGGSLSTNPHTGLPEAGLLGKLLPLIAGIGLNFVLPGSGLAIQGLSTAAQAGIMTGLASTAITGDLGKGLMAGVSAFGGASLAGAVAAPSTAAAGVAPEVVSTTVPGAEAFTEGLAPLVDTAAPVDLLAQLPGGVGGSVAEATPGFFSRFASNASAGLPGLAGKAAPYAAAAGVVAPFIPEPPKFEAPEEEEYNYRGPFRQAPRRVSYGEVSPIVSRDSSERLFFDPVNPQPGVIGQDESALDSVLRGYASGGGVERDYGFASPSASYQPTRAGMVDGFSTMGGKGGIGSLIARAKAAQEAAAAAKAGTTTPTRPVTPTPTPRPRAPLPKQYSPAAGAAVAPRPDSFAQWASSQGISDAIAGMNRGGRINMKNGSFVADARMVAEIGNGSSNAGIDILRKLGGKPVRGPGDGVSDSVRAKIGGKQEARVARDEVIFSPEAVRRLGGTKKLYALMNMAHKARKKAGRGTDSNLAAKIVKGLAAL
jgi:hypothetical protein